MLRQNLSKMKWRYVITVSLIITLSIALRIYYDIKHHEKMLSDKITTLATAIKLRFNQEIQHLNSHYSAIADFYIQNRADIIALVASNQRQALHKKVFQEYELFKAIDPNLYVMHFFDTNTTTILRMHKPQSYGDHLSKVRPIVYHVNQTHYPFNGFEVGKNGITYRITHPLFENDKHIGVLEFGIKPQYFVDTLKQSFSIDAQVLIKSDKLKILVKQKKLKSIEEYSLLYQDSLFSKIETQYNIHNKRDMIEFNGQKYLIINNLELQSYDKQNIAKIALAYNITNFINSNKHSLTHLNIINIMMLLFALIVFFIIMQIYNATIIENFIKIDRLNIKTQTDGLTQIYNKEFFHNYLDNFMNLKKKGVIIFFDIDHFKNINDTYGHLAGDEVLKHLTSLIKTHLRDEDILARWGGEEFVILVDNITLDQSITKANKLRQIVARTTFPSNIELTISMGVKEIEDNQQMEDIMKEADSLLYQAKESGRNRVCY